MTITQEQVKRILQDKGASLDFRTGQPTKKRGFLVSQKDTEATIQDASHYSIDDLTIIINEILKNNAYNDELNQKNILGFWIDENDILYIDITKCLNVSKKDIYKVKNEALINNQYAVYNNETGTTYNVIIPIYTLYNTSELLKTPESITNYSKDFYKYEDIKEYLNLSTNGSLNDIIYNSVDDIPEDYNYSKVIIKDLTNYTRDIIDTDANLSIEDAFKYSRLIEA